METGQQGCSDCPKRFRAPPGRGSGSPFLAPGSVQPSLGKISGGPGTPSGTSCSRGCMTYTYSTLESIGGWTNFPTPVERALVIGNEIPRIVAHKCIIEASIGKHIESPHSPGYRSNHSVESCFFSVSTKLFCTCLHDCPVLQV
jgi:hypothetical protein